jgi:hypothetical protein
MNFQGVLLEGGQPVTGARDFAIKIFDAAIGGTELYAETIGSVPVVNGVYSFEYGISGTSNALTTETVASADGTASTFQKVLSATTIVAGSVTVSDGTYTWDQINGSSNESEFSVSYSSSLKRLTVNYYSGTPAVGKTITTSYRAPISGFSGVLSGAVSRWIEVKAGGLTQATRERLLQVPLSRRALEVDENAITSLKKTVSIEPGFLSFVNWVSSAGNGTRAEPFAFLPIATAGGDGDGDKVCGYILPNNISNVRGVHFKFSFVNPSNYTSTFKVIVRSAKGIVLIEKIFSGGLASRTEYLPINLAVSMGSPLVIEFQLLKYVPYASFYRYGGAVLEWFKIDAELAISGVW